MYTGYREIMGALAVAAAIVVAGGPARAGGDTVRAGQDGVVRVDAGPSANSDRARAAEMETLEAVVVEPSTPTEAEMDAALSELAGEVELVDLQAFVGFLASYREIQKLNATYERLAQRIDDTQTVEQVYMETQHAIDRVLAEHGLDGEQYHAFLQAAHENPSLRTLLSDRR